MATKTTTTRKRAPQRRKPVNDVIDTYFPVAKWLWSGIVVIAIAIGSSFYYMKMDAALMNAEVQNNARVNKEQSEQLKEQSRLLRDIHTQQLRAADALTNLEKNITPSIESMNRSIDHAHKRIDEMIREKKSGN